MRSDSVCGPHVADHGQLWSGGSGRREAAGEMYSCGLLGCWVRSMTMYRPCIPTQIPCPGPQGPGAPVAKPQPVSSSAWRSHTRARCPTALPFGTVIRGRASLARPVCRVYPRGSRPLQQGAAAVGEAHQPRFACSPVCLRPVYQPCFVRSFARAATVE